MSSTLKINRDRPVGKTIRLEFPERPICSHCGKKMVIRHSSKPKMLIDLQENIFIVRCYYQCNKEGCLGTELPYFKAPNPICPANSDYTYMVYAKICQYRWQKRRTYHEICSDMKSDFNIQMSGTTVENALKIYEIGCSIKYLPQYQNQIQENGGVIITIDGMAPLKGNKSLYVVYDYYTGLTIAAQRLQNQKADTIEEFLSGVKNKIENDLKVPVVGIISDALPSQRIGIERVFPEVPHCLCHYHFYKLILIEAHDADSKLITQIRKKLRNSSVMKKYSSETIKFEKIHESEPILRDLLETLETLSNWKRKPKDPCFSGLVLFNRVCDIYSLLNEKFTIKISDEGLRRINCPFANIYKTLHEIVEYNRPIAIELASIQAHLEEISTILDDLDLSFNDGLEKLRKYCTNLRKRRNLNSCGDLERNFIKELTKYFKTKGEMLFNFKKVKNAPTTNNRHELKYKQLKHLLRRVIGFAAAKFYLLSHGERIVFIQPGEIFENIVKILQNTDFEQARNIIADERRPRNSLPNIVHYDSKWEDKMAQLTKLVDETMIPLSIII